MSDPISLINGAITVITSIRNQYKKLDQLRFESIVAEMTKQLTEAQVEISALIQKNLDLEKENRKLLDDKRNPPKWIKGFYVDEAGELLCTGCYDNHQKRIHLNKTGKDVSHDYFKCPVCSFEHKLECSPDEKEKRMQAMWGPTGRRQPRTPPI
jgi:hypothetical protein